MAPTLDLDFVRAQFPAFAVERLGGQGFFDNAGGSYMCGPVMERLDRFFRERKVQPYGPYEASRLGVFRRPFSSVTVSDMASPLRSATATRACSL